MRKLLYVSCTLLFLCSAINTVFSQAPSVCGTPTYYTHIREAQGKKIELKELQTLPDGSFIAIGNILNQPPLSRLAVILKYSNEGVLMAQQQITVDNSPGIAADMKITLQGKILIAGTINTNSVFLMQLNENLVHEWTKKLEPGLAAEKIILQLFDEKPAIAVQHTNAVSCFMLDNAGGITWSRKTDIPDLVSLAGFLVPNGLVVNCFRNGIQQVEVIELDGATGNVLGSHIIGDGNTGNICFETTAFNGRASLSGVSKEPTGDFRLARYNMFGSAVSETKHTYNVNAPVDFNISGAMDNAGDAMGFCLPQTGQLIFIKQFSAYQTFPEHTRSYTVPTGSSIQAITRSRDGGYLFGINTAANNEFILIKTDSIGILAGCGYTDLTNEFTEVLNTANTPVNRVGISIAPVISTIATVLSATDFTSQFDCNEKYCPPPPVIDTCLETYFKTFRSGSYVEGINGYKIMRGDKRMITSTAIERIGGGMNQLTRSINMLNEKGEFINGATVLKNGISPSFDVYPMSDSTFMLIQYFSENNRGYYNYSLVTDNYNIVWSKTIGSDGSLNGGGFIFGNYYADREGNFYIVGTTLGFMERPKINVYKLGPNGQDLWGKTYEMAGGLFSTVIVTATNTSLVIVVNANNPGTVSVQIDKNTGAMLNSHVWQTTFNGSNTLKYLYFAGDRILYFNNTADDYLLLGILDTTGKPVTAKKIITPFPTVFRAGCFKQNKFYGHYNYYNGIQNTEGLIKVDSAINIEYITETITPLYGYPSGMDVADNGHIYMPGNYFYGINSVYGESFIKKYNPNGTIGTCVYNNVSYITENINPAPAPLGYTESSFQVLPGTYSFDLIPDTSGQRLANVFCSSVSTCDTINVSGPDTVCSINRKINYSIYKNPGCLLSPVIENDTARYSVILLTDTSVSVSFKQTGNTWVKTFINTGCKIIRDSIMVYVSDNTFFLSLGADTAVCEGDSVLLTPDGNFQQYEWQDGTTGHSFIAKDSGRYYVKAYDNCGQLYSDSIYVNWHSIPVLHLSPDTVLLCERDTLTVSNPAGFANYSWLPANIISGNSTGVDIIPLQNVTVFLTAATAAGCKKTDSVFLIVNPLPVIHLGSDTSVCSYDSLQLAVPGGYPSYLWSTGNNSNRITVKSAGTYWLLVTSIDGCTAKDSITVLHHPIQQPELGNDFSLCDGESKILDAQIFTSYQWQDNSLSRYFTVTDTGLYTVAVIDSNSCKAADSVRLLAVNPLPSDFLPQNDSICQYENFIIAPNTDFVSYLWQDNSTRSDFEANKAGEYILTVRDGKGCYGKDSITLFAKNCFEGLYIPSAFSPNGDTKNDVFRVKLYGVLVYFRLEIFNRYGELMYISTDPYRGWDGNYKGKPALGGSYVFQCAYTFAGKKEWIKKGSIVLIR